MMFRAQTLHLSPSCNSTLKQMNITDLHSIFPMDFHFLLLSKCDRKCVRCERFENLFMKSWRAFFLSLIVAFLNA